jgi:hypothetical protein
VKNGSAIYEEINDSIRNNMPDTTVFELFLIKLTDDEVGIDAYVPNNEQFMEDVACIFMNTTFSGMIPKNRKIRIYSYSNPDGSGDSPFEVGIKNNHTTCRKQNGARIQSRKAPQTALENCGEMVYLGEAVVVVRKREAGDILFCETDKLVVCNRQPQLNYAEAANK